MKVATYLMTVYQPKVAKFCQSPAHGVDRYFVTQPATDFLSSSAFPRDER